jgi:hypothetical protein
MNTLQMASLSGNQFDQRGKKFAINQQPRLKLVLRRQFFLQVKMAKTGGGFR